MTELLRDGLMRPGRPAGEPPVQLIPIASCREAIDRIRAAVQTVQVMQDDGTIDGLDGYTLDAIDAILDAEAER